MTVIRASASCTEHSVLARQIAVWLNLIPYHSGPGGLSVPVLVDWGRGHMQCSITSSLVSLRQSEPCG